MLYHLQSLFKTMCVLVLVAACSLPRGAPLQSEISSNSKNKNPDVAVYSITKSFLPTVANWPKTGETISGRWLKHAHIRNAPIIAVGDVVQMVIWDSEENSLLTAPEQKAINITNVKVSSSGTIFVPYLEKIKIAGLTDEAARQKIQSELKSIIPSAQVQLTTIPGTNRSVSLISGVVAPGAYPIIDPHDTILRLISRGGGVSPALLNPQVKFIRAGRTYKSSVARLFENPTLDSIVKGGDKIIIQNDQRYFRSLGAASKEQIIDFPEDNITALDAMSLIGGLTDSRANPQGILVLREYPANAVRTDGSGPSKRRTIFVIDLTSSDGIFSAGRFEINSKDTVLVTESSLTTINTIFGVIGSVVGISNGISNFAN